MKKSLFTLFCLVSLTSIAIFNGCKKDEDNPTEPSTSESVPVSIFPLAAGHSLIYSGYVTNAGTEEQVAGSDVSFYSRWDIAGVTPFSAVFGPLAPLITAYNNGITSATLVLDTTYVNTSVPKPPRSKTPVFAYYDSTKKAYYYLTNLGLTFRDYNIKDSASASGVRRDSLRFIKLADVSVKTGVEFECFKGTYTSYATSTPSEIVITINGTFEAKESRTVKGSVSGGDTTMTAYRLVVKRNATLNGTPVLTGGVTAKIWLVDKIGPVEMFLAGDREANGTYRKLSGKNF